MCEHASFGLAFLYFYFVLRLKGDLLMYACTLQINTQLIERGKVMSSVQIISVVAVIAYMAVILIAARLLSKRGKTAAGEVSHNLPWYIIAGCTMATITNAAQLLGNAGASFQVGYAQMFWANIFAALFMFITVPLMANRMRTVQCNTLAELAVKRFPKSTRMNVVLTAWSLFWGLFANALSVFGGAVVLQTLLGVNFWVGAVIVIGVAIVYNALGGMEAMSIVDTVQYIFIGILVGILTFLLFKEYGSFSAFASALLGNTGYNLTAAGEALGITPGFFDVFHMPGWGAKGFIAYILACSLWACCDLGVIGRFLAQRTRGDGTRGMRAYTIIFLPTVLLMASYGIWGRGMFASLDAPDSVVLLVAEKIMGGAGTVLFLLATAAAILSTVGAYINAVGMTCVNIYKKVKKDQSEKHYKIAEICSTLIVAILSLLMAKIFGYSGISITAVAVQMILVATLTPTVLCTCFWKRFNERAAFWGVVLGIVISMASMFYAGGAYAAIMGGGFFGIPTLFLGWIVVLIVFVGLSFSKPYTVEDNGPEFRALFENKQPFSKMDGAKDIVVGGILIIAAAIICGLGLTGKLGAFPTFDNPIADIALIAFACISIVGALFLGSFLVRRTFGKKSDR
ncbi:MAG: hypothetical protein IJU78_08175 [Clostridia bacterium]|nr:hypothetical protein [Clostridia bacterium]